MKTHVIEIYQSIGFLNLGHHEAEIVDFKVFFPHIQHLKLKTWVVQTIGAKPEILKVVIPSLPSLNADLFIVSAHPQGKNQFKTLEEAFKATHKPESRFLIERAKHLQDFEELKNKRTELEKKTGGTAAIREGFIIAQKKNRSLKSELTLVLTEITKRMSRLKYYDPQTVAPKHKELKDLQAHVAQHFRNLKA